MNKPKLCVALDQEKYLDDFLLAEKLRTFPVMFKIGWRRFLTNGKRMLKALEHLNVPVILDLKIHETAYHMQYATEALLEEYGSILEGFTIHTAIGQRGMEATMAAVNEYGRKKGYAPKVIGITQLPAMSNEEFIEVQADRAGMEISPEDVEAHVINQVVLANQAGLDGVMCSVDQAIYVANLDDFISFVTGIRCGILPDEDHFQTSTLEEAIRNKADIITMGRPIFMSEDPVDKVRKILERIDFLVEEQES